MMARWPLRRRVAFACALLGLLLSAAFAAATWYLAEDYEEILITEILQGQAQDYAERLRSDPALALPRTPRLSGYLRRTDGSGDLPPELAALQPGVHEIDENGRHASIVDTSAGRLAFVIDISAIEALERYLLIFLVVVVVCGTAFGGWAGGVLARRAISPVRELADAVDALPVRAAPTTLVRLVGADELGRLARAIDAYQARLVDAAAAESAFFADASHELRTPIAVVKGAVDVLLDEPSADPALRRRIARLERGVDELADLIEALLGLARRREYDESTIDAAAFLDEAVAPVRLAASDLRVSIETVATMALARLPALIVLRGLLRRLVPPLSRGMLDIGADAARVVLVFKPDRDGHREGRSGAAAQLAGRSDGDLAPTLIARFARHLGWRIEETAGENGARSAILHFTATRAD